MEHKSSYLSVYCVYFLLQMMTSSSEILRVTTPTGHLVAKVGGQAELTCQLSPPQSAEHMEVHWFRGDHSQPVHLFRGGHGINRDASPEYVNRTVFVKEAIGEGKVTLRIHNISISDAGPYWCSFNESGFSGMANMSLRVAAIGLQTEIHVLKHSINVFLVECYSGGWFPQPQMEWRDDRGVVPYSSVSYSQDEAKLFHTKMTLLKIPLRINFTCHILNPLTGEEKQTSIILDYSQFYQDYFRIMYLIYIPFLILILMFLRYCLLCFKKAGCTFRGLCLSSKLRSTHLQILSFCFVLLFALYLPFRIRVSISDPLFTLYNSWMTEMIVGIYILMAGLTILGIWFLWNPKDSVKENKGATFTSS